MTFLHSIRWRLQLWHGVLLAVVLAGFGVTVWRLDRTARLQRVDQELERRVGGIVNALRRPGPARPGRGAAPDEPPLPGEATRTSPAPPPRPDRPGAPRAELRLGQRDVEAFQGGPGSDYYVVWDWRGTEVASSVATPAPVPHPERLERREARSRGVFREYVHVTDAGESILVGRDISNEWEAMRRLAWVLAAVGFGLFGAGLAGGWWVSTRALRPIADISAAARTISVGALSHRIPVPDAGSELADLAHVLNETFGRLQASFDRQSQFTADASHELRTPVAVVLTQAQSALSRERSAEEYREALAACQRSAQRMRRLIDSLLELARLDSGDDTSARRTMCDLHVLAGEVAEQLRPDALRTGITLVLDTAPVSCPGNPAQLERVIANLVANAIQYNRPNGTITVRCGLEDGVAVLSVEDSGPGIAAEDLPHVFERFYRADRSRAGERAGLGLAIVKAIVDAHGGTIEAVTEPGLGSRFTVRLPSTTALTSTLP